MNHKLLTGTSFAQHRYSTKLSCLVHENVYSRKRLTSNPKERIDVKKVAFMFPGQGTQYVGMGKDIVSSFKIAKESFLRVDERLQLNLSR